MILLPELDTPPKSGVFVEHFDLELTEEEIALGNADGEKTHDKVANVDQDVLPSNR